MKKSTIILFIGLAALVSSVYAQSPRKVQLANIFGDNMVVQQLVDFPVWGFAEPGTEVIVEFLDAKERAIVDSEGKWMLKIPPMKAGGPYELKVIADRPIILKNVMVGEVWLASGQSNMEFTLRKTFTAEEDIASANYPNIRVFSVPSDVSIYPLDDIKPSVWREATSANAAYFSAVAYHFAKELHQNLQVPIGIINASRGGTPAEAWTSADVLSKIPEFKTKMLNLKKVASTWNEEAKKLQELQNERNQIVKTAAEGIKTGVNKTSFNDSEWQVNEYPLTMPKMGKQGYWGFVWLRKTVNLRKSDLSSTLELHLPLVAQQYLVYVNGKEVGKGSDTSRTITLQKDLLEDGKNMLAIRMLSYYGKAELGLDDKQAAIYSPEKNIRIPLNGEWKFNFDIEPKIVGSLSFPKTPSVLYNAMIAPLMPFAIKGVIWYQGEANAVDPKLYQTLFPAMIENWRSAWGQSYFPFAFVQLAGYSRPGAEDLKWALLREAQFMTLTTPNTMMATAIDVGEEKDIHPRNKKDVGYRLALAVRKQVYGQDLVYSGPVFHDIRIHGNKATIEFTQIGTGLVSSNGRALSGFEIAGKDQVFYKAEAEIIDDKVLVSSSKVPDPVAVRYAFRSYPQVNLFNKERLPAVPFRTDDW